MGSDTNVRCETSVIRASCRGGGGGGGGWPGIPPPLLNKSEFLIIIINGNSYQYYLKNVNQSTILLLFCLKISRTSSKFTAESSGPQWQFLQADEGFSQ